MKQRPTPASPSISISPAIQEHFITTEFPAAEGDPYYPIPRDENQRLYKRYEALAAESETWFVGRLATYRYYNMDQVVGQALATWRKQVVPVQDVLPAPNRAQSYG